MKLEYDKESDCAYIYIEYPIKDSLIKKTVKLNENILLDFDKNNKLLGVEVLNASVHLNSNVIRDKEVNA
ncbi:MAG: DUF2283 domain-containing protein [Nanoarchaeota archaeon]